jgi:methylglutaconyl-CoA hydratase
MSTLVRHERRGVGSVLTLDSPANRNALSKTLVEQLHAALAADREDPGVRTVVITGEGGTFCSGADLKDPPVSAGAGSFTDVLRTLWDYPKPVVVAINGHVRAGGFGLVAAGDVVLCSRSATFSFSEVRLGLVPAIISVLCLRRMTPVTATRYLLTGEKFGPDEALGAGLVSELVDEAELTAGVDRLLEEFRQCEPVALRETRALIRSIPGMDAAAGFTVAEQVSQRMFASPGGAEGIAAFRERRSPSWAVS